MQTFNVIVKVRGENELDMFRRGGQDSVHPQDFEVDGGAQLFDCLKQAIR
jgi:hypothetical protein